MLKQFPCIGEGTWGLVHRVLAETHIIPWQEARVYGCRYWQVRVVLRGQLKFSSN